MDRTKTLSDAGGSLTDTYDYEAFGEVINQAGSTENSYLFAGEQFDAALNQYYLRTRYYNQQIGRFTQMDTWIGNNRDPISLHKYAHANADPVTYVDPTGHFGLASFGIASDIRMTLSNMQIDIEFSLLDAALDPESAANGDNYKALGLAAIGGPAAFKLLGMLSKKFRQACNSFDGETLVSTEFGLVAIKDIKIGDRVWAYNEETGEKSLQEVVHLIQKEGEKELVDIELATGEVITATAGHPFFLPETREWMNAGELTTSQLLQDFAGNSLSIADVRPYRESAQVYNLTVNYEHTYFVSVNRILSHNAGICPKNANWKSVKSFGHTFNTHGAGKKNTKRLVDRARSTGNDQGQWLDNEKAADFLAVISHSIDTSTTVKIPLGLGQVITKDGRTLMAEWAIVVPSSNGLKTAYPILKN